MKMAGKISVLIQIAIMVFLSSTLFAATDGFYNLFPTSYTWDGTDANRQNTKTTDYTYTYGDEASVTYSLPWNFAFYGQTFSTITADTNGNIWFGSSGSNHSLNLISNGRGPVIAAWNNDLSSYYYGGVYIQHMTDPEKVVIEWQTETYTDEGRRRPNNFEAVLFPNGEIRLDYKSFTQTATNQDFGSGTSLNDGTYYVNLTNEKGNVFSLAGQSFLATAVGSTKILDISFTGRGTVTSNVGASWNYSQPVTVPTGAQIELHASPGLGYNFTGWSGPCSGNGSCYISLNQDTTVSTIFSQDTSLQLILSSTGAQGRSLQTAYNAASTDSTLKLMATDFIEDFDANQDKTITIEGGYNIDFTNRSAGQSVLKGAMTITSGTLVVDGFTIQ